jgi:UDP-N-acetyl-D-galactosamine dehydrogenase
MKITVVGLGYVGAPLAVELARHFDVVGFDINDTRVRELRDGFDRTNEIDEQALRLTRCLFTIAKTRAAESEVFIVTVPTPVDSANVPDLTAVRVASKTVGEWLKHGDVVIYESTVYPGVTEEVCVPILEQISKMKHRDDFSVGYSPERINPGDKINTLTTTTKIVSGDSPATLDVVDSIYSKITKTFRAATIKVAEAAKVIENTQRDVNIALMNELSQIFCKLGIDTNDVLEAAGSKWNFQRFKPGLVGGHCISVDPYYLSHKAAAHGIVSDVILSAREINDSMARHVVCEVIRLAVVHKIINNSPVTILGTTFKPNVPDIRNSKVANMVEHFEQHGLVVQVTDPHALSMEVNHEFGYDLFELTELHDTQIVVLAVPHDEYIQHGWELIQRLVRSRNLCIVADLGGVLDRNTKPDNMILWRF